MRMLVLGGTVFLGRAVADAARAHGHEATVFHRGRHAVHRTDVEDLHGDRDPERAPGLTALQGGRWDAVIDTSGYVPRHVRASAELLRDQGVRWYGLVSTINVYPAVPAGLDESHPVHAPILDQEEVTVETYGPLKVGCENAVREAFEAAAIVRPGLIVGPHDPTNRFTYWCTRIAAAGDVLVPATPDQRVQVVDVRDLAELLVGAAERGLSGVVNAAGGAHTLGGLLEKIRAVTGSEARLVPVDPDALEAAGVAPWSELPLWLPERYGVFDVDDSRAKAWGLSLRPIEDTIAATLAWARTAGPAAGADGFLRLPASGLAAERERELLAKLGPRLG